MTNTTVSRTAILSPSRLTPPDPPPPRPASSRPTLAVVLAQILADTTLPPVRRRDMASGLRRFAKALDKPLDRLIADPGTLRASQKDISPVMVGLTKGSWQGVISRVRAALKHTGVIHVAPRPLLSKDPSSALFPGRGRLYKCTRALRIKIVECAKQRARVKIHPHLCRHIAAKLHLDAYPGAYGTVRLLLGHKSVNTTTKFYCGAETKAAFSQFDQLIRKLRDNAAACLPARRR